MVICPNVVSPPKELLQHHCCCCRRSWQVLFSRATLFHLILLFFYYLLFSSTFFFVEREKKTDFLDAVKKKREEKRILPPQHRQWVAMNSVKRLVSTKRGVSQQVGDTPKKEKWHTPHTHSKMARLHFTFRPACYIKKWPTKSHRLTRNAIPIPVHPSRILIWIIDKSWVLIEHDVKFKFKQFDVVKEESH